MNAVVKHRRMTGVTIHNHGGLRACGKRLVDPTGTDKRILFAQDHKKVCDLVPIQAIKHESNCLNIRVKRNDIIMSEGYMGESGIDSLKYYDSLVSA